MDRISVTLPDDMIVRLSEVVEESYDNRSEAVRALLSKGLEYENRITELEAEYEGRIAELEQENERLQRQLAATNKRVDEHTELVEYVEEERSWRSAGLGTRVKWWLLGKDE